MFITDKAKALILAAMEENNSSSIRVVFAGMG